MTIQLNVSETLGMDEVNTLFFTGVLKKYQDENTDNHPTTYSTHIEDVMLVEVTILGKTMEKAEFCNIFGEAQWKEYEKHETEVFLD